MARYTRKLGRTAHEFEDEDCDEDDDRDEWKRGGPEFKLGHVKFVSPDFMDSSALITNHRGRVLTRLTHGVWGEELEGNFNKVPFTFTGHRREARTGHLMALHRYLDPRAGRWTQRDPLGNVDGFNRFTYVSNAPLTSIDAAGLFASAFGTFNASLSTTLIRNDSRQLHFKGAFKMDFTPISQGTLPCSGIGFLQVLARTVDGKPDALDEEMKLYWIPATGHHVDLLKSKRGTTPYYSEFDVVRVGDPAFPMSDDPEFQQGAVRGGVPSRVRYEFETIIVGRGGSDAGRVYGGVAWGMDYSGGKLTPQNPRQITTVGPQFRPAVRAYMQKYIHLVPQYKEALTLKF